MSDEVVVYRDAEKQWRWRRIADDRTIIATSGEGYHNVDDCSQAAVRVNRMVYVLLVDLGSADTVQTDTTQELRTPT